MTREMTKTSFDFLINFSNFLINDEDDDLFLKVDKFEMT